jgi:V/A-type H+-transporting ATPase subunit E
MPLDSIVQEIYRKGEEQVQAIINEAKREAEKIIAEAEEKAKEILEKARKDGEKEAEALRRQEISSVRLEMKRQLLNKQREVLEAVFKAVEERIKNMDLDTKKKIYTALLKQNAVEGMVVCSNKDDEDLIKSIIQELGLNARYGGNIDCLGGVVIESADGEFRVNLTFEELLNQLYEQKMSELSKMLFG